MEVLKENEPYGGNSYSAVLGRHAGNPPNGRQTGVPLAVLDEGYLLSTDENRIKAQFEQVLLGRVEAHIADMRRRDPVEALSLQEAFIADIAAYNFTWDGKVSRAARGEWEGNCLLLWLMLRRCHGQENLTLDDARDMMHDDSKACMSALRQAQGNWPTSIRREERQKRRAERKKEAEALLKGQATPPTPTKQNPTETAGNEAQAQPNSNPGQ